jgi:1,4-alpha-glucan branching enzyme
MVKRLIRARRRHPALRSDHIRIFDNDFARDHLIRFCRWDDAGDYAVCAINFGAEARTVELPVPASGRWHDVVGNRQRVAEDGRLTVRLGPYDAALFVTVAARRGEDTA